MPSSDILLNLLAGTPCKRFVNLASGGVYIAPYVTVGAVSSYLAFSTLPFRAVIFCCTFLKVTFTRRYLAPCSMELGLSSLNGITVPRSHTTDLLVYFSIIFFICKPFYFFTPFILSSIIFESYS